MVRPVLSKWCVVISVLLISINIFGQRSALATKGPACLENPALCSEQDSVDQKPYAFWARKPTGKFTKQEIFDICAQTAMLGYNGLEARLKGRSKSEGIEQESRIMTSKYEQSNKGLKAREPLLYEKARKLYAEIGEKLYDTALTGGQQSLAHLLERDGFEEFYPKLVSGCYRNLATW